MRTTTFALVFLSLLGHGAELVHAVPDPQPDVDQAVDQRLFPDGRVYNFGTVYRGTRAEHSLRVVNRNAVPMNISLRMA